MKKNSIIDKLKEWDIALEDLCLGDFDQIGEFTAKKNRAPNSTLYNSVGCFFRPNYERGILIYNLIREFEITSMLEIGFGRGYATFCAAKAMCDHGIEGKITTVDPMFGSIENHLKHLSQIFPKQWFEKIDFVKTTSDEFFIQNDKNYDFIYIDGDHSYNAVKKDWENSKTLYNKFLLFDDYHLPTKQSDGGIECAKLIDEINDPTKELIMMDRRIFFDDRRISDEDLDYGQVLLTRKNLED